MSDKKRNVPVLRFNGFSDAWEQRKLGELANSYSGGTPSLGKTEYYGGNIPFIRSAEINSNSTELFLTKDGLKNSSAKMVSAGDILYALYGATSGEVGLSKINGAINQAILAIQPQEGYNSQFIMQWLRLQKQKIIDKYLQGGQGNLSGAIVKDFDIEFPIYEEQKKIGNFFKQLDNTIALHQRKLDALKQMKKGFLQQLFPENGEKVPRVRFADFQEEWEQRKLGDITDSFEYGLNASAKEYDGKSKYIRITDIDESSHLFNQENLTSPDTCLDYANNYLLEEGDILFARTGASTGKSYCYTKNDGRVYFAGFLIRARIKQKYDVKFIFQNTLTSKYNNFIQITSQRSGQPGINALEYSKFALCIPKLTEQNKIGSFFQQLDKTIAIYHYRLDQLNILKKACLQSMFI
ncbi:restriction endonuclease subunit S [Listeria booriae]|uniref:restriction endonuclease subunit S n=1 Tax=Listeria booriae TaxID=1552123 RepID=UPI001624FE18|nr:restriction endonuclease subunit S [Listeria booriae]MBC1887698.1 restriction endonuclease subunit S [Listeria booriae]